MKYNKKIRLTFLIILLFVVIVLAVIKNFKSTNTSILVAHKKPIIVGFAQLGSESAWRNANTESVKQAAEDLGVGLIFENAEGDKELQKQIIEEFIIQQVDVIVLPPLVADGWDDILIKAKEAKIPVIIADRLINTKHPELYAVSIGSDFYEEGRRAARWLVRNTNPNKQINIVEIRGLAGSSPTEDRAKGFRQVIAKSPNIKIIDSADGDFIKAKGELIMSNMLKKHGKNINVVFSHNDDMALGAIRAIKSYGLRPGKDILVVSVDGEKAALEAIKNKELNVSVECSPTMGPLIIQAARSLARGEKIPRRIVSKEKVFTIKNVDQELPLRTY